MRRSGMLLCGLLFVVGLILLIYLAPGWLNPFGWSWNSTSYAWWPGYWGWGGFPVVGLAMLIFCVLMMGGMMWHGQPHMHSAPSRWVSPPRESLSDILERRYSQGEITKDEFEEIKQALSVSDAGLANEHARH